VIRPALSHDALLADICAADRRDGGFRLWWLGQSGFLLQWQGVHVLLDPYLSDSLTRKYSQTDKPHVRMTELAIDPTRLCFVDVATSSHNHTDHLDAETLGPILAHNPSLKLLVPEANHAFAADRLKIDPTTLVGVDDGGTIELSGIRFFGMASSHETVERDEQGRVKMLGYVLQFDEWSLYHSGDTVRYEGMAEELRRFAIDVALLPINGRTPERRVPGNLFGPEAAQLAHDIGAKLAMVEREPRGQGRVKPPVKFQTALYRSTRPEPPPFKRASTSSTLERLKSPWTECFRQLAAAANSSASCRVGSIW
jgi:L-ascorbate metabolism protein UlaG (beta-lactamase superfamily)